MQSRLITYLNKHLLLDKNQFGFQKNDSAKIAIVNLLEKLQDAMNNNEYSLAVFADYHISFETINHYIL